MAALRSVSFDNPSDMAAFMAAVKEVTVATKVSGGTGYHTNDILDVLGGTGERIAQLKVTGQTLGVITSVSIQDVGAYTVAPTNPVSVTGGFGSGATFNLTLASAAIIQTDILSIETVRHRWYLLYWV